MSLLRHSLRALQGAGSSIGGFNTGLGGAVYVNGLGTGPEGLVRGYSMKKPETDRMVPIDPTPPAWVNSLPKGMRKYFTWNTQAPHQWDLFTGVRRSQMTYPVKYFNKNVDRQWPMTLHEAEIYYGNPKEGVDHIYDPPVGSEYNPLIIEQGIRSLDQHAVIYCSGGCAPHIPPGISYWGMWVGMLYQCGKCGAYMAMDGKEDIIWTPQSTPEDWEEAPPFEFVKRDLEFWSKRGMPEGSAWFGQDY